MIDIAWKKDLSVNTKSVYTSAKNDQSFHFSLFQSPLGGFRYQYCEKASQRIFSQSTNQNDQFCIVLGIKLCDIADAQADSLILICRMI